MADPLLDLIVARLSRPVPPPPAGKPAKSFAKLRPGDLLREATARSDSPPLQVTGVTRSEATLSDGRHLARDWALKWVKVPKERKKKGAS